MWDLVIYLFPNWEWISNQHFARRVITYPCLDYSWSKIVKGPHANFVHQNWILTCGSFVSLTIVQSMMSSMELGINNNSRYSCHINLSHYSEVLMSAMASQITDVSIVCSTENITAPFHFPWRGSTGDRCISSQRASDAGNVPIWWRHHVKSCASLL